MIALVATGALESNGSDCALAHSAAVGGAAGKPRAGRKRKAKMVRLETFKTLRIPFPQLTRSISVWRSVMRERRALGKLSDEALRDLGLSRAATEREAARAFWDAPFARR